MAPLEIAQEGSYRRGICSIKKRVNCSYLWVDCTIDTKIDENASDDEILAELAKFCKGDAFSLEVHELNGDVRLWDGSRWRYIVGASEEAKRAMIAEDASLRFPGK